MIIECAGLPGAGKTTVCNLVSRPHGKKGCVPLSAIRPGGALLRSAWSIFALCLTTRPFRLNRLRRGFKLILFLRHYEHRQRNIVLDHGIVQKVWSILADAGVYSRIRLERVMGSLLPFAPDHVVWLETPLEVAVERMGTRIGGRSRYDEMTRHVAVGLLNDRAGLLQALARRFCQVTGAKLLVLEGGHDPAVNAALIDALMSADPDRSQA